MTTSHSSAHHAMAPSRVIRGGSAWQESLPHIARLCRKPALLGRSVATAGLRQQLINDLQAHGLEGVEVCLQHDCCEEDLQRSAQVIKAAGCDGVLAAGGGKVLDAGKLLADRLDLACITVPLSAATCAGWTALSNIYSPRALLSAMWS